MGQILVRNIDSEVIARLKKIADSKGKSVEQTLRDLITDFSLSDREAFWAEADRIRETTKGASGPDIIALIREDRDTDHGQTT